MVACQSSCYKEILCDKKVLFKGRMMQTVTCMMGSWTVYHADIMLACSCSVDPLTLHFYIVKLGFTGVYIIFLFLL